MLCHILSVGVMINSRLTTIWYLSRYRNSTRRTRRSLQTLYTFLFVSSIPVHIWILLQLNSTKVTFKAQKITYVSRIWEKAKLFCGECFWPFFKHEVNDINVGPGFWNIIPRIYLIHNIRGHILDKISCLYNRRQLHSWISWLSSLLSTKQPHILRAICAKSAIVEILEDHFAAQL